jgi:4-amino-4-deoxychorismate lyase
MLISLVDGVPDAGVPADDRGLAYGDGIFRTMAMRGGQVPRWPRHFAKLVSDCAVLGMQPPPEEAFLRDIRVIAASAPDCSLRITVTRGSGGRGYAGPENPRPRRIVCADRLPAYPMEWATTGVTVRLCTLRLAEQPALAGIKHLNRLENVLARAEWNDPAIAEGLLQDAAGNIIEGTRCNLFLVENGTLVTPDLSRCGVAGVTRELVMAATERHGLRCSVETVSLLRLESATEILLVNSLIGVWPHSGRCGGGSFPSRHS